jgi:hypothetical protein
MSASIVYSDDPRIKLVLDVPTMLSNKAIDEAVVMAASHLKYLLGKRYRHQIGQRVTARAMKRDTA